MPPTPQTLRELFYWSYANLAMAHHGVNSGLLQYDKLSFIIRSRLYKGLVTGTMNIRSLFDDEKVKLQTGQCCNYCGTTSHLSLDHILPLALGGPDNPDNLICACRACNSSKGKKDLMEWMEQRGAFLPLMVIRRYLKLMYAYSENLQLLDSSLDNTELDVLPFKTNLIPVSYPQPCKLILTVVEKA
jgi:hypothetical protein